MALGVCLLLVALLWFDSETLFPGIAAVIPTFGTALIIFAGTLPRVRDGRDGYGGLSFLGDTSYSWYLWHWPLIVFAGALWPSSGALPLVVAAAISLLVGRLSYSLLESRVRKATLPGWRTPAMVVGCVSLPIFAVAASLPLAGFVSASPGMTKILDARQLHVDVLKGCDNATPLAERFDDGCTWGNPSYGRSAILIGDSNAGQFSEGLIAAASRERVNLRVATMSGCRFVELDERVGEAAKLCDSFVRESLAELLVNPVDLVVIANSSDDVNGYQPSDYEAGLALTINKLTDAGIKVAVIKVIPKPLKWDPGKCSPLAVLTDFGTCSFDSFPLRESFATQAANQSEQRAADSGGAATWDYSGDLCPAAVCVGVRQGAYVWRDRNHLSVAGSGMLSDSMSRDLARSVQPD